MIPSLRSPRLERVPPGRDKRAVNMVLENINYLFFLVIIIHRSNATDEYQVSERANG
jgi:hypothetical protein